MLVLGLPAAVQGRLSPARSAQHEQLLLDETADVASQTVSLKSTEINDTFENVDGQNETQTSLSIATYITKDSIRPSGYSTVEGYLSK